MENSRILDWLSPPTFLDRHNEILSRRIAETGNWIFDTGEFTSWIERGSGGLWCHGWPGVGKTVLASVVADHLQKKYWGTDQSMRVGIANIYCDYKVHTEHTAGSVIASILRQLLQRRHVKDQISLPADVLASCQRHIAVGSTLDFDDLLTLLEKQVLAFDKVCIIVDALDELYEHGDSAVSALLYAFERLQSNINLFITARDYPQLGRAFEGFTKLKIWNHTESDLRTYAAVRIREDYRLEKFVKQRPGFLEFAVHELMEKSCGMFLAVTLLLFLVKGSSLREIKESLRDLPSSLHDIYTVTFTTIMGQHSGRAVLAENVLTWICCALRPMTISELHFGLSLEAVREQHNPDKDTFTRHLVEVCGGLVSVDKGSQSLRLIHPSAEWFFIEFTLPAMKQALIALQCLKCLSLKDYEDGPCISDMAFEERLSQNPLLGYAASHWAFHAKASWLDEPGLKGAALELLTHKPKLLSAVQAMHATTRSSFPNYSQQFPRDVSALHIAAFFGLEIVCLELLEHDAPIDACDDYYGSPLQAAASCGHVSTVRLLLDKGARVDTLSGKYGTALQAAAYLGLEDVVSHLLQVGSDPNVMGGLYDTALQAAALKGHVKVGDLLLDYGAVVDSRKMGGCAAIHRAAEKGREKMVRLLLNHGAEVDLRDADHGRTPLLWAASHGFRDVVKLLLDAGANIDAVDHQHCTPLHLALERHHETTVNLLVERGAKLAVRNLADKTQFQMAMDSIEKIDSSNFHVDEGLTDLIEPTTQAVVTVYRRKTGDKASHEKYELIVRKAFSTKFQNSETQRNLVRERQLLQNVNHPNLVKYLKYEEDKARRKVYLYTEYCEGGDLRKYHRDCDSPRKLTRREAWALLSDLAAGVAYCHHGLSKDEHGSYSLKHHWHPILHRDIKPANVVLSALDNDFQVAKLCDLGWAKTWNDPGGTQTIQVGTVRYMPPEVKDGGSWTQKGDIYSLGATLADLERDTLDQEYEGLLNLCMLRSPVQRPSSLILLERAEARLAQIMKRPASPSLLPNITHTKLDYLCQATLELLGRWFTPYAALSSDRAEALATRIRLMIDDGEGGREQTMQGLGVGDSPHVAILLKDFERAKTLIEEGETSEYCLLHTGGLTPLHIACRDGLGDIVDSWLRHNPDPNMRTEDGLTALHYAALSGHRDACRQLLSKSANVDIRDRKGATALHKAAEMGQVEVVKTLLNHKADVTARDENHATALHRAAATGNREMTEILLQAGSDLVAMDMQGFKPERNASTNGHEELANWLRSSQQLQETS